MTKREKKRKRERRAERDKGAIEKERNERG